MHRDPPDVTPAAAHYQQALTLAEELGMRLLQAHCHLGLGALYTTTGHGSRRAWRCLPLLLCIALWTWCSGCPRQRRRWPRWREETIHQDTFEGGRDVGRESL